MTSETEDLGGSSQKLLLKEADEAAYRAERAESEAASADEKACEYRRIAARWRDLAARHRKAAAALDGIDLVLNLYVTRQHPTNMPPSGRLVPRGTFLPDGDTYSALIDDEAAPAPSDPPDFVEPHL